MQAPSGTRFARGGGERLVTLSAMAPAAHVGATFAPLEIVPLAIAAALYAKRSATLSSAGRPVPR